MAITKEEIREDFCDLVYSELRDEPDNTKANLIIDEFDKIIEFYENKIIEFFYSWKVE